MSDGCASGWATLFAFTAALNSCGTASSSDVKALERKIDALNSSCKAAPTAYQSQSATPVPTVLTAKAAVARP